MKTIQYTIVKIPIKEIISQNYHVTLDKDTEIDKEYVIAQGDSPLIDQIRRLTGKSSMHIKEMILVVAKKNPKQEEALRHILDAGFTYNGIHYSRFGKSASQGKDGITAFICDEIFDELYRITQMDIPVEECVISKYEAWRCLPFSSCTLIHDYMPNIVIIGEHEKTLKHQFIKYVAERKIKEGYKDVKLSPFDGCGCHEYEFMEKVSSELGFDYRVTGVQVRLPFIKGYSVYVPFRKILKEWGYDTITDIYGVKHPIDTIDCIWNTSMFKGHKLFQEKYGDNAWAEYMNTIKKYQIKLGISKYSHHIRHLNKFTRMNFQYLQCLDLWNPKYIDCYEKNAFRSYNILDHNNDGKIITLARYTTTLFENIIKGNKFYTYKFMGITNTQDYEPQSNYLKAALIHDTMLKDPAIKQFIYRKLKKSIDDAKVGKIYCSGFYHTGVGDMIGYLQYAVGEEPVGCLKKGELYSGNFDSGDIISFRSPLVDPSEVNKIKIVRNNMIDKWFGYFKDQDIVMFNMYDISAPQQGGADFDGDIFFLCNDPIVIDSKIEKPIILDIEDKITAKPKPYTKENIIEYEVMTRDSRIGEITNAATSIENRYTRDEERKKMYSDYSSLLRIYQGKEIDFIKTGFRWHMTSALRKHLKQLPYFLLYNYPEKLKAYKTLSEKKVKLNAFHSPSPMNELCDYICTWEKRNILWANSADDLAEVKHLILRNDLELPDRKITRVIRRYINEYADEIRRHINSGIESGYNMNEIINRYKRNLSQELQLEEEIIANYVIMVSYKNFSISKSFAWTGYGEYIIENIKKNSTPGNAVTITEVPCQTENSYEYLGKYYVFK